jgi:hypothetical protein
MAAGLGTPLVHGPPAKSRIAQPSAGGDTAVLLPLPRIADFIEDGRSLSG